MDKLLHANRLPLLPIRDMVVFPNIVVSIFVGRQVSINAMQHCVDNHIILVTQRDGNVDTPTQFDLFQIGVLCRIIQITKLSDQGYMLSVEGVSRVRIDNLNIGSYIDTEFIKIETKSSENNPKLEAHLQSLIRSFEEYATIQSRYPAELTESILRSTDKESIVNKIATNLPIKIQSKQSILEETDIEAQMDMLLEHIESEKYIVELEQRIRSRIKKQVEQTQKEVLREQVNAIQKELSEDEDELLVIENKLRELNLTTEAREKSESELRRLKSMNPISAEASILRSYLECIIDLPWNKNIEINKNLKSAEEILNKYHYGLEKTKERIFEFISMQSRMDKVRGPVLCLYGPPGVGKTSLAKAIAEATGRPFVRISLGGVRDEAEIRGHRRTYVGAMPGKIIQAMRSSKFSNPLILLDEIGNIGKDWRGDPETALLEVLDPEQNSEFRDHYLDLGYDLSSAIFIATTNQLNLQPALLDRFEIISMSGYTSTEKFEIASKYLISNQRKIHGLDENEIHISGDAIRTLISDYTREAGLRNLDREIANLTRKVLRKIETSKEEAHPITTISIDKDNLKDFAGIPKYDKPESMARDTVGVVAGLAWTEMGGTVLFVESVTMPGTGKLIITGKLGDVMQESAKAALSLIRSSADHYGIKEDFFKNHDIHLHVPEGATPKDGPSAGITIFTSLLSAITKIPVNHEVAMTGELRLNGEVLPIGGLKEKTLAAHRAKIKTILIPEHNSKNLDEIPDEVKNETNIRMCKEISEVIKYSIPTLYVNQNTQS